MIYVQHNGQQLGPFTIEQVRQYLAMGQFSPQDLAVQQGGTQWLPLAQLMAHLAAHQPLLPGPLGTPAPGQQSLMLPGSPPQNQPFAQPQQPMATAPVPYQTPQPQYPQHPHYAPQSNEPPKSIAGTVTAGYICMGVSLICFPPFVGLAAFILGIINCTKGKPNTTHGIIQTVCSIICAFIGMAIGAAMAS